MQALTFYQQIQHPAEMLYPAPVFLPTSLLLLTIAGVETAWGARVQVPGGQARGFWQCQKDGAIANAMARRLLTCRRVCDTLCVPCDIDTIFEAIAWNDALAFAIARVALDCDPNPIPSIGDAQNAWATYLRVWRPGKPSEDRFMLAYHEALAVLAPPAVTKPARKTISAEPSVSSAGHTVAG